MAKRSRRCHSAGDGQPQAPTAALLAAVIELREGPGGAREITAGVKGSYVDAAAAHLFLNLGMDNRCAGFRSRISIPVRQSPRCTSPVLACV